MTELDHTEAKQEKSSFSSRYTLESKLGTGGMGVVYKAYDNVLHKPVAVKVLLPNSQSDAIIRFHQEAKMTARLSHLNILTVLDFGQNEAGDLYLVMDFLDGESLHDKLKSHGGSLPLQEAISIFLQICSGLQHAHSQGILHRDIKPSNIMLVKDERGMTQVKIVDFGLAKVQGAEQSLTTTGMRVGSPLYMSPEQAQTDSIDLRADIYSLGCLMYKTLTGKAPLIGETFLITIDMHANEIPRSINDVKPDLHFSSELANIVAKTLEKDPANRFQSCSELADALLGLDLSFLLVAPPVVQPIDDAIVLLPANKKSKTVFGVSVNLLAAVCALLVCIFVLGKAIIGALDSPIQPTAPIETRDLITDTMTIDVLTDKLYCERDGSLSAQDDFADANMEEILRFKDGQVRLSFAKSMVTGARFSLLRKMKKLEDLNLADTKIDDEALKQVGKLKKLKVLNLDNDRVGDIGLGYLSSLKNLEILKCERTLITNLGIEKLTNLEKLNSLDISGCAQVNGTCLDVIAKLPSLRALYIVQCPAITKADIERFRASTRKMCAVISEGVLVASKDEEKDDPKRKKEEEESNVARQRHHLARAVFLRYKDDMRNPRFFKFFQNKDCWKPRKSYADIKDPRIVECLKDQQLREVLKDPEIAQKWNSKETWVFMQHMEDRMKTYFPPEDFAR